MRSLCFLSSCTGLLRLPNRHPARKRRRRSFTWMPRRAMPSTPSIPTALSAVLLTFFRTTRSTRFIPRTSFRSHSRQAGDRLVIATILSCGWRRGTGMRMGRGAIRRTRADTSPGAPSSRNRCATFFLTRYRIAVFRPAATGRCKVLISVTGKAIHISPASSRERVTRCIRSG